ncbi:LADA_0B03114g1_1 [Lachancea dasiensis]|uniref:LADA_0B03114g1_1 n=1 Tax=Lachancea dasiensis TaxID=1072105 RepID=A0A1G4ISJ7_9SACH|nr:LADA_0B03114g1_1 [Lachancea dasiensis]
MLLRVLFLHFAPLPILGLHFYMRNDSTRCFYENLAVQHIISAKFNATATIDGLYEKEVDIDLTLTVSETFENNNLAMTKHVKSFGGFDFTALESGEHRFCIHSAVSKAQCVLRVEMNLDIATLRPPGVASAQHRQQAKERINRLVKRLEVLRSHQRTVKNREKAVTILGERLHSKVLSGSFFQAIVSVAICLFQLRSLRGLAGLND